jgi:hypothetical protein
MSAAEHDCRRDVDWYHGEAECYVCGKRLHDLDEPIDTFPQYVSDVQTGKSTPRASGTSRALATSHRVR